MLESGIAARRFDQRLDVVDQGFGSTHGQHLSLQGRQLNGFDHRSQLVGQGALPARY